MSKQFGLGRGFDALLPTEVDKALLEDDSNRIQKLLITDVYANTEQPRKEFNQKALEELAESIRTHGVLQPIIVVQKNDKTYRIVAGERRYRASQIAGLDKIPAIVRTLNELREVEIALVENVQRVDLSPYEQAVAIARLQQQFSLKYADIAKKLGKAETTVNNIVRLLHLPEDAVKALVGKKITEGHARQILALKDNPEMQAQLLAHCIENNWSVRQAEQFVTAYKKGAHTAQTAKKSLVTQTSETKRLSVSLNAPVRIKRSAKGGTLAIGFTTDEDLQRILQALTTQSKSK
ncbi:ParB/RepB/Spo0J family partition protein [bacterium]|nr:ParB/RepB/Spo0J family partition protein [bacterium]NBX97601.1 ParB/RepB/Spo0J family partition protein [bacterium]NDC94556.1 ParB/RepB/Spo0J family partition protein [bacterium]NDD84149.1 ParB/RepB/Spo0J family partition protein [bacterium]NDG29964.1 ParB/RepB/Spo0J family partition protein [bacterium]